MHALSSPSSFDFIDHQLKSTPTPQQSPTLSTYRTPMNLIKDVFFPTDAITEQTNHSLEAMSKKMAKIAKSKTTTKRSTAKKPKVSKSKSALRTTKPKKVSKTSRKKAKTTKTEMLSGKGFNIRHF